MPKSLLQNKCSMSRIFCISVLFIVQIRISTYLVELSVQLTHTHVQYLHWPHFFPVQFPVMSGHSLDVDLTVFDREGRPFDNFTSLNLKWGSSDTKVMQAPPDGGLNHHGNYAVMSVPLTHVISSVELKVTSESYLRKVLQEENVLLSQQSFTAVSAKLGLLLRKAPTLMPTSLLIFNHPANEVGCADTYIRMWESWTWGCIKPCMHM